MTTLDPSEGAEAERDALKMLARRPLTEAELRRRLADRGHESAQVESACERMRGAGYLDDARLAYEFIVLRAPRLGQGRRRLLLDLQRRGVAESVAAAAWREAVEQGELDPAQLLRRKVERQLRGARYLAGDRDYARVYNALRRAGFDEESIRNELEPYRASNSHGDPTTEETTHDLS